MLLNSGLPSVDIIVRNFSEAAVLVANNIITFQATLGIYMAALMPIMTTNTNSES